MYSIRTEHTLILNHKHGRIYYSHKSKVWIALSWLVIARWRLQAAEFFWNKHSIKKHAVRTYVQTENHFVMYEVKSVASVKLRDFTYGNLEMHTFYHPAWIYGAIIIVFIIPRSDGI